MKANRVGYIIGYILGSILIYGVYGVALFGMFDQIRNGQVPYVPLILFIVMLIWRRVFNNYAILMAIYLNLSQRPSKGVESNDQLNRLMQQVLKHGGPN